jgi:hypothetical protein
MLKKSLALLFCLLSVSASAAKLVPVKGEALHFSCLFANNEGEKLPYFIEVSREHTYVKISLNHRRDQHGQGHPRLFLADMRKVDQVISDSHLFMVFKNRHSRLETLSLTTPRYMSEFLGAHNQIASLEMADGYKLEGPCFVQFRPFPPQF